MNLMWFCIKDIQAIAIKNIILLYIVHIVSVACQWPLLRHQCYQWLLGIVSRYGIMSLYVWVTDSKRLESLKCWTPIIAWSIALVFYLVGHQSRKLSLKLCFAFSSDICCDSFLRQHFLLAVTSWQYSEPIRGQYSGHVICLDQSEASITLLRMISGATYSGVPQKVQVFLPASMCFENPKSTIFMYPSLSETIVVH